MIRKLMGIFLIFRISAVSEHQSKYDKSTVKSTASKFLFQALLNCKKLSTGEIYFTEKVAKTGRDGDRLKLYVGFIR